MTDGASAFKPAEDSVRWANDAINEMWAEFAAFFEADPTEIITEVDAETGENVQKLRLKTLLPETVRRKAVEGLSNAKNAFDQATFAARNLTTGPSSKSIYYPWSSSPTDLEHLLSKRGIDQRLWGTFQAHEPYPTSDSHTGGDDKIRRWATLANSKHTIGLSVFGHIAIYNAPTVVSGRVTSLKILAPKWDPQKNEAELVRWIGNVEVANNHEFGFQVVLKQPPASKPVDVFIGLRAFAKKAHDVTESLKARCFELGL